jgi:Ca2+/Na+ antiporter
MIGASVLAIVASLDGVVDRIEGFWLVALLVAYTIWSIRASRREAAKE